MNSEVVIIVQAFLRAFHVIFAIAWIGFLFYFVLVQQSAASAMTTGKEEMLERFVPRAMYWFRWSALWTFLTGVLLLGMVYHMGGLLYEEGEGNGAVAMLVFLAALLMAGIWDQVVERFSSLVATLVGLLMLMTLIVLMNRVADFGGRSLFIHIGGVLGLVLVMNVWMRVWPAWRRDLLPVLSAGGEVNQEIVDKLGYRSRQSVFIAVPTVLLMISNHYPNLYGTDQREAVLMGIIAFGFLVAWLLIRKQVPGVEGQTS